MSDNHKTDVLIVGYGPVGAAMACLLGGFGVKTIVIDKAESIFMAPRAIALDNEALRILRLVGLHDDAFEKVIISFVKMHSPYFGQFGQFNTAGTINHYPKLVTFYQPELESALRNKVSEHESVTQLLGVELLSFTQSEGDLKASTRDKSGADISIEAKFMVAADGASSQIRKSIGQDFGGQTYSEDWLIVDAKSVPKPIDHIEFVCDPKRPTPHMVAPGNRERWEFMLRPGESKEVMESDEMIRSLLAHWGNPEKIEIERRAVYRFHARCCDSFSKGRVFLVGDAAHVTPPFVGQGLVAGLRDVANLAWKLNFVLNGRANEAALNSYDAERRPHARSMIALAKFMGRLVMPRSELAAFSIHGTMRLLRSIPFFKPWFDDMRVKPANEYKKGLFLRKRGAVRSGGSFPQIRLRGQNNELVLSDALLGNGLTLIGLGCNPAQHLRQSELDEFLREGGTLIQINGAPSTDTNTWFDEEGLLISQKHAQPLVILVRPDQIVMSCSSPDQLSATLKASSALLK